MPRQSPSHYINPSSVSIVPNANGSADDLAVDVAAGTRIKVLSKGSPELDFSNGSPREWYLAGRNRRLAGQGPYTIYARLAKDDTEDGYIVFAPKQQDGGEWKDKYPYVTIRGLASGTAGTATGGYWYFRIGDVSEPQAGRRTVTFDSGILGTDQYNSEWNLDPDDMPQRVLIQCFLGGVDAGPTPYVPWDSSLLLQATFIEGWDTVEVDHWSISRRTGTGEGDTAEWPDEERAEEFGRYGDIFLSHMRGADDDFAGAVSVTLEVTAWGRYVDAGTEDGTEGGQGQDDGGDDGREQDDDIVALASAAVTVFAETTEKYELEMSTSVVTFSQGSGQYYPPDGVTLRIRATDQRSGAYKLTAAQIASAGLEVQYAPVGEDTWTGVTFAGGEDAAAEATVPVEAFSGQQNVNVRIVRTVASWDGGSAESELTRQTIAFVRDSENGSDLYLSKLHDDVAQGLITFLKGIEAGEYRRDEYHTENDSGAKIFPDGTGDFVNLIFSMILKSKGAREGFTDGSGIWMDGRQGLIQTDGLDVRGFMRVMELVINRLQLMESDYSFTEGADVEHIDYVDGGSRLKLWVHKEHDNDRVPFYEGDILYMKVNSLLPAGAVPDGHTPTKNGSYYTVWLRADEIDFTDNAVIARLYRSRRADEAPVVPGGRNFTPYGSPIIGQADPASVLAREMDVTAGEAADNRVVSGVPGATLGEAGFDTRLTMTRRGNDGASDDPQIHRSQLGRQQSWVLSTTDQRISFLWHVDSPIVGDDNYALCLGMLPDLKNLPATRNRDMPSLYINTLFYSHEHRIAWPARVVKEDRGQWSAAPEALYTGPSGTYVPDGTLPEGSPYSEAVTVATGDRIRDPYHFRSIPRGTFLRYRLGGAYGTLTDQELMEKILVEWTEEADLETSRAWYQDSLWECVTDGTADVPSVRSTGWTLVLDRRYAKEYRMVFCDNLLYPYGDIITQYPGSVDIYVVPVVEWGGEDISGEVGGWLWKKYLVGADGTPVEQEQWRKISREAHITDADMPSAWGRNNPVIFTCTATLEGHDVEIEASMRLG